MSVEPQHIETWLYGQLALGIVYIVKEFFRISRDQSHKNTEDIGTIKINLAEQKKDLDSAWERIRMIERSARSVSRNSDS